MIPIEVSRLTAGHEEKFDTDESPTELLTDEKAPGKRRFRSLAYSGADVARIYGRLVVNIEGIEIPERMGMLLEHDDLKPVAVCDNHSKRGGALRLEGYFLDDVASKGEATSLVARMDQGFPVKKSIGIRFKKHSFYEEGVDFEVNGRKMRGPMVCVDESYLFETSFIHVNPADLDTEASIMRARAQEQRMAVEAEKAPEVERISGRTEAEILADGERRAIERIKEEQVVEAALRQAYPGKGEKAKALRMKARQQKMNLADIQRAGIERMKNRLEKYKRTESDKQGALDKLESAAPQAGVPGADPQRLEVVQTQTEIFVAQNIDARVVAELKAMPRLHELFGQNGGPDAGAVLSAWCKTKGRKSTRDGKPVLTDLRAKDGRVNAQTLESLERMAHDVMMGMQAERLDVGGGGPDYSRTIVNGFQGMFYQSYEEELSKNWSMELSFQIPTDQKAEIVRWLGAPPMLQEWSGPRIAKGIPIYEQIIQAVKFEGTLDVDRFDWGHQKWDLIAKAFGLFGAVASQHWDIRFSKLLELNPTAYDGKTLFSASHTLGGDSGTIINDYSATGTGATKGIAPVLNVNNPSSPAQLEWANIILQLTPKFRSFAWANGVKMHGTARQWGVMVHPDVEGNAQAAVSSERLDLGATNPLFGQRSQYKIIPNAYLTDPSVGYIFRLDTQNKALLRAEPDPLEMSWQGPGSHMAFHEDKYAMGMRCVRSIAPGAFESVIRFTLGNT